MTLSKTLDTSDHRAGRQVRALLMAVTIALIATLAPTIEAEAKPHEAPTQDEVSIQYWRGGRCFTYSKATWTADVCAYANIHDFYGWRQGLGQINRNFTGEQLIIHNIQLYKDGFLGWASTGPRETTSGTFIDNWTGWDKSCSCTQHSYQSRMEFTITWPDGTTTGREYLWSNPWTG